MASKKSEAVVRDIRIINQPPNSSPGGQARLKSWLSGHPLIAHPK